MDRLYNNRFIFIVTISIIFIMVLGFSSVVLTKKSATTFMGSGYVLSDSDKALFSSSTTYRYNLNKKIVFENNGRVYEINPDTIVHYDNGNISLLQNGALTDLSNLDNEMTSFYNITNKSIIEYTNDGYKVKNGNTSIGFSNILLRISDNKYMVAGKDLSIRIPGQASKINSEFFEIEFIEEGIVVIKTEDDSYEVTTNGTYLYVQDGTIIDLDTQNVLVDSQVVMNLSQVTINGDENINIVPEKFLESTDSDESSYESSENPNGTGSGSDAADNGPSSNQGEIIKPTPLDNEVSVELVSLDTNVESVSAIFQVNNLNSVRGKLVAKIINNNTLEEINPVYNISSNGLLSVSSSSLVQDTPYTLRIEEVNALKNNTVYFQRVFTTDSFGVTLKKVLISSDEIDYRVYFQEGAGVSDVTFDLYKDGNIVDGETKVVTPSNPDLKFINLNSNTNYTIRLTTYKVNHINYLNNMGYKNIKVKTLKQKPTVTSSKVLASEDNSKFNLFLEGIDDPDSSIKSYTFRVYEYDKLDSEPVYSKTTTNEAISLTVGENEINTNTNYRYDVLIEYNDNEINRELISPLSSKFIITGASVKFILDDNNTTFNKIAGSIYLEDPDCSVPISGRPLCNQENHLNVSYYVNGVKRYKEVTFVKTDKEDVFVSDNFYIDGLSANTLYVMELNGDMYEEDVLLSNVMIGREFSAKTTGIPTLKVELKSINESNYEMPITATVSLASNSTSPTFIDNVKTMNISLYALDRSGNKIHIGNTKTIDNDLIKNLLYNKEYTITNKFFDIDNMDKLIEVLDLAVDEYLNINYIIEFSDAYDVPLINVDENSNEIDIENNEVKVTISKKYLLEYYAQNKELSQARLSEILNRDLDKKNKVKNVDDSIVVAYKIDATIYVENILREYYGLSGDTPNWDYVYTIYDKDMNLIYTSDKTKSLTHTFYLDDDKIPNFDRGNEYSFKFQIILSDGVYPEEAVLAVMEDGTSVVNPVKTNAIISNFINSSTDNSITLRYRIDIDLDKSIHGYNLYLYDKNDTLIDTEEISESKNYQTVTFKNIPEAGIYKVAYNKINNATDEGYTRSNIFSIIFDGKHTINGFYQLHYEDSGNKLGVQIIDDNTLNRALAYEVKLSSSTNNKTFVFKNNELVDCTSNLKTDCLTINYSEVEEFQGASTKVEVTSYYDSGLTGFEQVSPTNKYVLQGLQNNVFNYLTISPTGKIESANTYSNGLYSFTLNKGDYSNMSMEIYNTIDDKSWVDGVHKTINNIIPGISGISINSYGTYNPKAISKSNMTAMGEKGNIFVFSSIVPMVDLTYDHTINSITIKASVKGLTSKLVNNQFRSTDKKIYVDMDIDGTVKTLSQPIDMDDLKKRLSFKFDSLKPDTVYSYHVYAYLVNNSGEYIKTDLYDYRQDEAFVISERNARTMNKTDILQLIDSYYETISYTSRVLNIESSIINTENYTLRYEILDNNSYVLPAKNIDTVKSLLNINYEIMDTDFEFNNTNYKLKVTAITNDSNHYELELYYDTFTPHLKDNIQIKELREPTISIDSVNAFVKQGDKKYTIEFTPTILDKDYVIKDNYYYVELSDDDGNYYTPNGYTLTSDGTIKIDRSIINTKLTYSNLDANKTYYAVVTTNIYRNNFGLSEKEELTTGSNGYKEITTGNDFNITIGSGTISADGSHLYIDLIDSVNIENLTRVDLTIRKNSQLLKVANKNYVKNNDLVITKNGTNYRLTFNLPTNAELTNSDKINVTVKYYANRISDSVEDTVTSVKYINYSE